MSMNLSPDQIFEKLTNADHGKILCVGDVMLDHYVMGEVARISPEAPIPILSKSKEYYVAGGAANVAKNLAALKQDVVLLGLVGDDVAAQSLAALLDDVDLSLIKSPRPTTLKTRFMAGGQQLLRLDDEVKTPISSAEEKEIFSAFEKKLGEKIAVILLSDYAKGVLTPNLTQKIIASAQAQKIPVLVDPKGDDYSKYKGATLLSPNFSELQQAAKRSLPREDDITSAARELILSLNLEQLLVTRGAAGMMLIERQGDPFKIAANAREVFDVSGAGDTSIATLAAGMAAGLSVPESVRLANLAAGLAVEKQGTAIVGLEEIYWRLHQSMQKIDGTKLMALPQLLTSLEALRKTGKKIGFTNGCFDLLHPGHVRMLERSRAECDFLIVGLNTDASVKRLKGETRPVQNESARAAVLAGLQAVDVVVFFDQDTPLELIKAIRPDRLMKGADYKVEEVVGHDVVPTYGGRVVLIPLEEGHSTTKLIAKSKG